jgi:hypothetical protein
MAMMDCVTGRGLLRRGSCGGRPPPVNTVFVIAVMTSLNCGVDVLCLRAIEPDSTGQHAKTYPL